MIARRSRITALLFSCAAAALHAAEVSVPVLELGSIGRVLGGEFVLASHAKAELSVDGGYKFGGKLRFAFDAGDLEKALAYANAPAEPVAGAPTETDYNALVDRLANTTALAFDLAEVTVRKPFGFPLEFAYFIGRGDVFCSGDEFPARFGTRPVATAFRGFVYFPDGISGDPAFQYDGVHAVSGTGFSLAFSGLDRFVPQLYAYQDAATARTAADGGIYRGKFSADLRLMLDADAVKLEAFAGATGPSGTYGTYRAGALAFFTTGMGADFLAQMGITRWDPDEAFKVDNIFFLFEPRVDFGFSAIHVTLFYHPLWYRQRSTDEKGAVDVNFRLLLGDLQEGSAEGGIETTVSMRSSAAAGAPAAEPFKLSVAPFVSLATEGVRWDFRVRVNPMKYATPLEMFETFVGVRTGF